MIRVAISESLLDTLRGWALSTFINARLKRQEQFWELKLTSPKLVFIKVSKYVDIDRLLRFGMRNYTMFFDQGYLPLDQE
jgi:hypothetical protein